jgi:chromosome segregation ATPase
MTDAIQVSTINESEINMFREIFEKLTAAARVASEVNALREEMASMRAEFEALRARNESLAAEADEARRALAAAQENHATLQWDYTTLKQDYDTVNANLAKLTEERDNAERRAAEAERALENVRSDLLDERCKVAKLLEKKALAEAQASHDAKLLSTVNGHLNALEDLVNQIRTDLARRVYVPQDGPDFDRADKYDTEKGFWYYTAA